MPKNVAEHYKPNTSPKTIAFEKMISNGVDPHEARRLTGVSPSAFYKNQRRKDVIAAGSTIPILDKWSLKLPERVASAVKSIDKIAKGKWEGAKASDILAACKMIVDRAQPVNEPLVQGPQQFIQINIDSLSKAVNAINAMQAVGSIDISPDTPQAHAGTMPNGIIPPNPTLQSL